MITDTSPYCQATQRQVKAGRSPCGSQRRRCPQCQRRYTEEPGENGYPETLRPQAARMYVDGMNYRRIGRHLGVDHKSVMNWGKACTDQLHSAELPDEANNAETHDLYTFVRQKKTG